MTQKPQTPESPVTEGKGQFVQFPVHLIYGNPHLTRDDKWVLLALMGKCWEIGPHRLSYREIAKIADVPVSLLSTYTDKQGRQHEGILDRIVRVTGYLQVVRGKEIDPLTEKPRKQAQTYIYVDYPRLWRDNLNYCQARNVKQNMYCVEETDYQPDYQLDASVSNTNTSQTSKSVSNTNASVLNTNATVSYANRSVSNTNKSVHNVSVNSPPYITDYLDITDKEDYICDAAGADITDTHHTEVNDAVVLGETAGPVSRDDGIVDSLLPVSGDRASMVGSPLQAQDKATEATSQAQTAQTEEVTYVAVEPLAAAARSDIDVLDGIRRAQEVSDSYSHVTPDPLPSVSFLEADTARETGKQENMGAADENDTRSQCVSGSDTAVPLSLAAQGATNDTGDSLADAVLVAGDGATGHDRRPVVGDIHAVGESRRAGSESQQGARVGNSALREQDTGNRQVGTASRAAGERRTGERGAGPDTGDDRSVVPGVRTAGGSGTARGRGGKGAGVEPPAPNTTLVLPDEGAAWPSVETALLIAEHLRKRAFAPKQREKQAKKMQRVFADKPDLTRKEWHNAYESRNDAWWNEHNGPLTVDDIYANDRLQKEIDRLAAGHPSRNAKPKQEAPPQRPAPKPTGSPTATGPYTIDEERNKRNIERLLSGVPAKKLVPVGIPMPVMD